MKRVQRANVGTSEHVFLICASKTKAFNLKMRLIAAVPLVRRLATDYDSFAKQALLHRIGPATAIGGVTSAEMAKLYKSRMTDRGGAARNIYDQIRMSATICPLCGYAKVATVDHHLPKASYPGLALAPINLVPSCRYCNVVKSTMAPTQSTEETLHPYYDDVEEFAWLEARVSRGSLGPLVSFTVGTLPGWPMILAARVRRHFEAFDLRARYAVQAQVLLADLRAQLLELLDIGGPTAVHHHLLQSALSCRSRDLNSWQTAAYTALAYDTWFCAEGVRQIPAPERRKVLVSLPP